MLSRIVCGSNHAHLHTSISEHRGISPITGKHSTNPAISRFSHMQTPLGTQLILTTSKVFLPPLTHTSFYNIAFVNSERWLAKSRVDLTLWQHGKFPATLLLKFFVLYYKRNIKHFFRIDMYRLSYERRGDISFIARGTISYFVTSERSERGTKYYIVTRAKNWYYRVSNVTTYLSHTCAFIWSKNQIIFSNYLYFEYISEWMQNYCLKYAKQVEITKTNQK